MADLGLKTFNKLYPMMIRKYQDLIVDQNATEKDKINQIIQKLNALGKLSNDVVRDWNTVYQWAMNDGLATDVNNKIEALRASGELNTILQSVFNALTGDMTTLHTTAKDTTVNAINEVNDLAKNNQTQLTQNSLQLADLTQNKVFLKDFPRIGGETNDNGRFTRAFATITDNTEIVFEKGVTYSVSQGFTFMNNNLTLIGNGSTINSSTISATNLLNFGQDYRTTLSQNVTVTQGNPQLTMISVIGINVGDIMIFSSALDANGYSDGVYGEVVAIDSTNKIITLGTTPHKSFTSTTQYVCTSLRNIIVRGFNIVCSVNKTDTAIVLTNVINGLVEFNTLNGNLGRRGIAFQGTNGKIQFNYSGRFFDQALIDNRTGYGISVNGHNVTVEHNILYDCKHTIASGDRRFYSTNLHYFKNICRGVVDSSIASLASQIVDMHANCEGSIIENEIHNINNIASVPGLMIRNNGVRVERNTFNSIASSGTTIFGIVFKEYCAENVTIKDNRFKGYYNYTISLESNWITSGKNIKIQGNVLDSGQIRTNFPNNPPIQNLLITDNVLASGGIQIMNTINNGRVERNYVSSANVIYECGILFNDPNTNSVFIKSNDVTNNGGGAECIRFFGNNNIVKDNRVTMTVNGPPINNFNATGNNIIVDNMYTNYQGTISWYGQIQSATVVPASSGTINTAGLRTTRVNPSSPVSGMILQAGTYGGQEVTVINESSTVGNSVTFASSGSNVSGGSSVVLNGSQASKFIWDSGNSLWYKVS